MGLDIKKNCNGYSGIDINHIFYAEKLIKERREKEGRELKALVLPEDKLEHQNECFECEDIFEESFGDYVPVRQKDVDDFDEAWVCDVCLFKEDNK